MNAQARSAARAEGRPLPEAKPADADDSSDDSDEELVLVPEVRVVSRNMRRLTCCSLCSQPSAYAWHALHSRGAVITREKGIYGIWQCMHVSVQCVFLTNRPSHPSAQRSIVNDTVSAVKMEG